MDENGKKEITKRTVEVSICCKQLMILNDDKDNDYWEGRRPES